MYANVNSVMNPNHHVADALHLASLVHTLPLRRRCSCRIQASSSWT